MYGTKTNVMTRFGGKKPKLLGNGYSALTRKKNIICFGIIHKKLTTEEKEIFDHENPHWKKFFTDRQGKSA